jgi:hypothetical protein
VTSVYRDVFADMLDAVAADAAAVKSDHTRAVA